MIGPSTTTSYFILLTTIYFYIKYILVDKYGMNSKGLGIAITIMYLATMLFLQLKTN